MKLHQSPLRSTQGKSSSRNNISSKKSIPNNQYTDQQQKQIQPLNNQSSYNSYTERALSKSDYIDGNMTPEKLPQQRDSKSVTKSYNQTNNNQTQSNQKYSNIRQQSQLPLNQDEKPNQLRKLLDSFQNLIELVRNEQSEIYQDDIDTIHSVFDNLKNKIVKRKQHRQEQNEIEQKLNQIFLTEDKNQKQQSNQKQQINKSETKNTLTDKFQPILKQSQFTKNMQLSADKNARHQSSQVTHSQQQQVSQEFDITRDEILRFKEMQSQNQQLTKEKSKKLQQQINQGEKDLQRLRNEVDKSKSQSRVQTNLKNSNTTLQARKQQQIVTSKKQNAHVINNQHQIQKSSSQIMNDKFENDSQINSIAELERDVSINSNIPKSNLHSQQASLPQVYSIKKKSEGVQGGFQNSSSVQVFTKKKKSEGVQGGFQDVDKQQNQQQVSQKQTTQQKQDQQKQQNDKDHPKYVKQIDIIFGKADQIHTHVTNNCLFIFNLAKLINKKTHTLETWKDLQKYLLKIGKDAAIQELKEVSQNGQSVKTSDIDKLKKKYKCLNDKNCEFIYQILTSKYGDIKSKAEQYEHDEFQRQMVQKRQTSPQKVHGGNFIQETSLVKDHPNYYTGEVERIFGDNEILIDQDNIVKLADVMIKVKPPKDCNGAIIFIEKRDPNAPKQRQENPWDDDEGIEGYSHAINRKRRPGEYTENPMLNKNTNLNNQAQVNQLVEARKLMSKSVVDIHPTNDISYQFQNKDLEQKTLETQGQFIQLYSELQNRRQQRGDPTAFYNAVRDFYRDGNEQHDSPTRRLIDHKNTTVDHKQILRSSVDNLVKSDYSLTYTTGPNKTYVIEPHGGGLDYNLVQKDPSKFYDNFFNEDLTKHKIQNQQQDNKSMGMRKGSASSIRGQNQITTKITKRPHLKIIDKIRMKIAQRLSISMNNQIDLDKIQNILLDRGINDTIEHLFNQNKIQILDKNGKQQLENNNFSSRSNSRTSVRIEDKNQMQNDYSPSRLVIDELDLKHIQHKVSLISKKTKYLSK